MDCLIHVENWTLCAVSYQILNVGCVRALRAFSVQRGAALAPCAVARSSKVVTALCRAERTASVAVHEVQAAEAALFDRPFPPQILFRTARALSFRLGGPKQDA